MLAIGSWMEADSCTKVDSCTSIEEELEKTVNNLSNNSADGYFNIPEFDLCEWNFLSIQINIVNLTTDYHLFFSLYTANGTTAFNYYNVVINSEGDVGLNVRFVPAMCYPKPYPFGYCELHGPAWGVHFITGYLFWPPIPKRVCCRPCQANGERCRPSCCETRCVDRYVWQCDMNSYSCFPHDIKKICYEQHNACKCACAYNNPFCVLWAKELACDIELKYSIVAIVTQHVYPLYALSYKDHFN